ncbi:hexaprenyldihydroxybenzoate methyltransferase mitochondrial precursor [Aaosphaeria arxii CBS 175.79]|uniref:Ubiquinone biosynthesis O-methyltransferase, mitochondrial n=1 Tax=Aaosphaeria arxii CBS 175.79 TaxID=1450172 RepID=A0A6A5Y660_9PLEO|nr:hexaprenyldihydroxybenzoate methyltransferase mitochondrial precursor [Aaosphaeria arxii CBS 175.79]KAF2021042.1 hexaprenyldihydroxybenzoate methyltransferase mitochondrial precursor [Aaosphaeria arxii CBS 175.79]
MAATIPNHAFRSCLHISRRSLIRAAPFIRQQRAPLPLQAIRFTSATSAHPNASKSSVDPSEVSHFNALASSWWDPHGPSRLLHLMNPLRHEFISRCRLRTPGLDTEKLRYLDIGCGGGIFAESAARLPNTKSVTAIDPTPEVLKVAELHKKRDPALQAPGKLTYLNASIESLPKPESPSDGYDVVSVFEVLEHVNEPAPFLEQVMQQVKPGGWLVMSTIARTWTSWMVTNVMAEDVLGIVPKGTHDWSKYVNEAELRDWLTKKGWGKNGAMKTMGVMYVPGLGWKEVTGSEGWGNYFIGVRKDE